MSVVSGSLQTPLSPAAHCEPQKPTHSRKPAKSATFGASTVRLEPVGALASPLALLSLMAHELHCEQPSWQRIPMTHGSPLLPSQGTLDAPILNLSFSGLVLVWVILAFLNSDLSRNLVNQKSEQTPPEKDCKEAAVRCGRSTFSPNDGILVHLRSERVFQTRATELCRRRDEIQANVFSSIYQKQVSGVLASPPQMSFIQTRSPTLVPGPSVSSSNLAVLKLQADRL